MAKEQPPQSQDPLEELADLHNQVVEVFTKSMTQISETLNRMSELIYEINEMAEGGAPAAIPEPPKRRGRKPKDATPAAAPAPAPVAAANPWEQTEDDGFDDEDDEGDDDPEGDDDEGYDEEDDITLAAATQPSWGTPQQYVAPPIQCPTCANFDAPNTYCRRFLQNPPPHIVAAGCEAWAIRPDLAPPTPQPQIAAWGMTPDTPAPATAPAPEEPVRRRRTRQTAPAPEPEPEAPRRRGRPRRLAGATATPQVAPPTRGVVSADPPF